MTASTLAVPPDGTTLMASVLDELMPMHLRLGPDGRITHAGPTLLKMLEEERIAGRDFFDLFEVRRPGGITGVDALLGLHRARMTLHLCRAPDLPLRATLAPLANGAGAVIDVSLGLSFSRAVAEFSLTLQDFSPCDQTIELLYLQEANRSAAELSRHLTERLQAAHAAAEFQARTDALTGLANRRSMDRDLERLLRDPVLEFSVLHIDLDLFKAVNDTHGHAAGDAVLMAVGRILTEELRRKDRPARIGGDEFLVLLYETVEPAVAARIAARLIKRIEEPVAFEGTECRISASVGIATTAQYVERPTPEQIMADVDAALYRAKNAGRGQYWVHSNLPAAGTTATSDTKGTGEE